MKQTITQNDLLLYAYNELDEHRTQLISSAILQDNTLAEQFQEIIDTVDIMDGALLKPNPTSLQIILEESSSAMEVI